MPCKRTKRKKTKKKTKPLAMNASKKKKKTDPISLNKGKGKKMIEQMKTGSKSNLDPLAVDLDLEAVFLLLDSLRKHQLPHPVDSLLPTANGEVVDLADTTLSRFRRGRY